MNKRKIVLVLILLLLVLIFVSILSLSMGSKPLPFETVWQALTGVSSATFETAVVMERIPRTIFGIVAGAALALSGCVMQSITRNPIADPSILGINTGASLAVVIGISFFSISSAQQYIWLAFLGALVTAIFVYGIAIAGNGGATPMKLALAGAATSTALASLVNTVMLPNSQVMDQFRFWQTGSIGGASWHSISTVLPYLLIGFIVVMSLANTLEIMALGDEMASGLGVNTNRTRMIAAFGAVLLCGATTALAGPIGFVGLMVPHLVRMLVQTDTKTMFMLSGLGGSILLLVADIMGRIMAFPGELEVGIVTAILGAPVFILVIRRAKVKIS